MMSMMVVNHIIHDVSLVLWGKDKQISANPKDFVIKFPSCSLRGYLLILSIAIRRQRE